MKAVADIFIPTSKSIKALDECLKSLSNQTDKRFNILLVSLTSSSELKNVIKKYSKLNIRHIIQKNRGLVTAANLALRYANKKLFIRIDDDVTVTRYWFEYIVKTFKEEKKIGGVTGPTWLTRKGLYSRDSMVFLSPSKKKNVLTRAMSHFFKNYLYEGKLYAVGTFLKSGNFSIGSNFRKHTGQKKDVMNFEACNFAVRTKLLKEIKGFDTLFSLGLGEYHEADAAFRVRQLGYKIAFNPKAAVIHHIEADSPDSRPDAYHRIQNFIYFYKRHIGIKNIDYLMRFFSNILMQNIYYIYKFTKTGDISQLGAIPGTVVAVFKKI